VARLNADSTLDFVILAGDFTQYGLLKEYGWFRGIMDRLAVPYVTVIGNHDAQANGEAVYRSVFGPLDYAFTYGGVRFVCANTNAWEFSARVPDWTFLEAELASAGDSLRLFTVSHVPPFGDQMAGSGGEKWAALMARHRVELSIHGHQHNHRFEETYGDGVRYLVADNVGDRSYALVTVADTEITAERVEF
jgi:Icc protein